MCPDPVYIGVSISILSAKLPLVIFFIEAIPAAVVVASLYCVFIIYLAFFFFLKRLKKKIKKIAFIRLMIDCTRWVE